MVLGTFFPADFLSSETGDFFSGRFFIFGNGWKTVETCQNWPAGGLGEPGVGFGGTASRFWGNRFPELPDTISLPDCKNPKASLVGEQIIIPAEDPNIGGKGPLLNDV